MTKQPLTKGWEEVNCICCDGDAVPKLVWPDQERGHIVRCPVCGLVFRSPRRTETYLDQHFKEEWTEARPAFFLEDYRKKNLARIAQWILTWHPHPGTILDVGSSYGTLLEMFPHTWQRIGIEPSSTALKIAQERLPEVKILNGTLGEATFSEQSFDVITMVDTIYYLPYPWRDFTRLRDLLKPDGIVLIEAQNFANRGKVYRWLGHSFDDTWMYFYTPVTLRKLLNKAGLEVVARFGLPGHQVGAAAWGKKLLTWTEFYLTNLLYRVSGRKLDIIPHFVLVAQRASAKCGITDL